MSRQLVIDRQHLLQMLSDPEFYATCPAFVWLRDTALTQAAAYRQSDTCCGGNWQLFAAVADAFFKNLQQLHALGPEHVACVREYLEKKKRRPCKPIVLFYRPTDRTRPRRFAF